MLKLVLPVLLAIATLGTVTWLLRRSPESPPPALATPDSRPASTSESLTAVRATRDPLELLDSVRFPDGSYLPLLNGAKGKVVMTWPAGRPFSPVVGKVGGGQSEEWYRHADGTLTTTVVKFRSDLGREDVLCQVANQVDAKQLLREDGTPGNRK